MRVIGTTQAVKSLHPKAQFTTADNVIMEWHSIDITQPTQEEIDAEIIRLQAEYEAKQYQRDRKAEYPTIEELVVALYDTEDKLAIGNKRAAIKLKYPKG